MSLDKSLNLSNAKKPQIVDQADARRRRLMKRIENQLIILEAVKNGEEPWSSPKIAVNSLQPD